MDKLKIFIHWGLPLVQFITAILAILCWNKNKSIAWKIFIIIWILTLLTETAGKIIGSYGIHNLWLYNLFNVIFYPGIIILYADIFFKKRLGLFAMFVSATLVLWAIGNLLIHDILLRLDTYYAAVSSTVIIFFALAYLTKLFFDKETTTPLRNDFYYWFSMGFIIYFSYNTVMIGMYTKITESKVSWLPAFIFYANHLITLVLHICLWTGFRAAFKWMK